MSNKDHQPCATCRMCKCDDVHDIRTFHDFVPEREQCGTLFMVTVPPGITKPLGHCMNFKPCPDHPTGVEV